MTRKTAAILVLLSVASLTLAGPERLWVGKFSETGLLDWEEHEFKGRSQYRLVDLGDTRVIRADSAAAASGLFRSITVNLNETPFLNWRWWVENTLTGTDEQTKGGDDYPARVYVVKKGFLPWNTKAVNYVWSSNQPVGTAWPNAYTGNARMLALQSGTEHSGQWQSERRNVKADFQTLFGEAVDEITTIALMTDTDNSGKQATAYYGDIYFSAE
ncbi:MAG: hypothetical protein C0631_00965 [Sedimenticola sp.]|nr:MAG: hypothetical protein C0631_00965 [Sedimenticola sp.]